MDLKRMSDIQLANYLKQYGKERKGELSELVNEAADRIFNFLSKIHSFREEDDLK